ncbi:MAG TPA: CoA transferase [Chloroflexota bacterium]|nr:CoA transferase [Chloroflexota bacterium]
MSNHPAVYGTRLLAEAGHELIRVEPSDGDWLRRLGPYLGDKPDLEHGAYHRFFNAGKKSLTLQLDHPDGREVWQKLVRTADAIVADGRLAGQAAALQAFNPNLTVTLMIDEGLPELCAYARGGLLMLTGHPGMAPAVMGGHVVYAATGMWAAFATSAALLARQAVGRGQTVTIDLEQALEVFMDHAVEHYSQSGRKAERRGFRGNNTAVSGAFPCADGYWMLSVSQAADRWQQMMDWVQDPVLMADPGLADEANRASQRDVILDRLALWCKDFKKQEAVEEAQRRHIPSAPVSTALDIVADPQLIARGFLAEMDDMEFGSVMTPVGPLATLAGRRLGPAPGLGEHTAELLAELGYTPAECQALFGAGVV